MRKRARKTTATPISVARDAELRAMLMAHQAEVQRDVRERIREGRASHTPEVRDEMEHSDESRQSGLDLALLEMRTETLAHIERALDRLDRGQYGSCAECEAEIAPRRLRALPFAIRCQSCEEDREQAREARRHLSPRRDDAVSLFAERVRP